MSAEFLVLTTSRFDREMKKLVAHHPELPGHYREILAALKADPYNRGRRYLIKKLQGVQAKDGQYPYPVGPLSIPVRHRGPVCIPEDLLAAAGGHLLMSRHRARRPAHSGSLSCCGSGSQKLEVNPTAYTSSATAPAEYASWAN